MPASRRNESTPTAMGPVLEIGRSRVLAGTCSWTDPTLVSGTDWYPRRTMSAAERLAYYARSFPLVEADSTYYRPPSEELTAGWARRSPEGFTFNVKAYSLFTHHPTRPETLWPDIAEAVKPDFRGKRTVYAEHLEADAVEEAWLRFHHSLAPLARSGRLGAVLMQYPRWFTPRRDNRDELAELRAHLPDTAICVEFRSPRWLQPDDADRTLGLLRDHGLALTVVDAPAVSGLAPLVAVTSEDLAVVRFHGRADQSWNKRDISAAERFRYLYDRSKLEEWAPKVRQLADQAAEVHLLMNNCYQDYGVRNAADLMQVLGDDGAEPVDRP